MEKKPQVSIIVPVYNAQEYLSRCVDSILNQEYQDFELLLVNDGSTDGSAALCDSYQEKDERVRAVHKENTGVSHSRNLALDEAQGTYIQFLDSDDWITPDATKLLVRSMEEYRCDLVIADFYRVAGERLSHKGDIEEEGVMSRQEFAAHMIENPADFYYGVLWNKMFRREIIEHFHIRMDTSISWCEDFLFNLEYIRHAHSFYALQAPVYYYLKRKGSLVSQGLSINNTIRMKINVFEYYNEFYKDVYDKESYENIRLQVYRFWLASARDGGVLPVPGNKRLGEEKNPIHKSVINSDGIAMDMYRIRKVLECQLTPVALKNNLTLAEAQLMLCLMQSCRHSGIAQLADFAGMTPGRTSILLQRLEKKKLVETKNQRKEASKREKASEAAESGEEQKRKGGKKEWHVRICPEAAGVLKDLENAQRDFRDICLQSLTDEEREAGEGFSDQVKQNMIAFLEKR